MGALGNRTCAVIVNPVLYKDDGIWNITIESGVGNNKTSVDYAHNVSVTDHGNNHYDHLFSVSRRPFIFI